jgi:hypothetical protein
VEVLALLFIMVVLLALALLVGSAWLILELHWHQLEVAVAGELWLVEWELMGHPVGFKGLAEAVEGFLDQVEMVFIVRQPLEVNRS